MILKSIEVKYYFNRPITYVLVFLHGISQKGRQSLLGD